MWAPLLFVSENYCGSIDLTLAIPDKVRSLGLEQ
jgi:hypothetical protein